MKRLLSHFFIPQKSNNHRSRALHFSSLFVYVFLLCLVQMGLNALPNHSGLILGYASNISIPDLLYKTNEKRAQNGLKPLVLNEKLNQAAQEKAKNMFSEQYWAHVSPTGKDPWFFIHNSGYNYLYAGENLARDFADSGSVVDAWMNSPSHKENLLNSHFSEIGFAVVNGKYGSYETTLVVQMFGSMATNPPTVETPEKTSQNNTVENVAPTTVKPAVGGAYQNAGMVSNQSLNLSIFNLTKAILLGLGVFILGIIVVDSLVVFKKKSFRLASHNGAHFLFLLGAIITILVLKSGLIT